MDVLLSQLKKYWGYDELRPLQAEAMRAVLDGRDSVVVLPTGGGKSLCYQAPALCMDRVAVVVSPLISLMKDQVDALTDCGVPAACVNSSMLPHEKKAVAERIAAGEIKLLYLSPERLLMPATLQYLQTIQPAFFAIDEAHCISDWGHDFRPEYRALRTLKEKFPDVAVHAYTATATERVREDIARDLQLREPEMLVGSFDRPNLIYRAYRRTDRLQQIREVIDRHSDESGIVYCIRRTDVEDVATSLNEAGISALPYHAGLSDEERHRNQDSFINDRVRVIVATVAFGMGIDKSDVRFVVHAGTPKSLESYQQESGRAGRDGLEAECCLLYSAGDLGTWRRMQSDLPSPAKEAAMKLLAGIEKFCTTANCRHQAILNYFGQEAESTSCGACDACLDELEFVEDSLVISQKILSCVVRLQQNFGAGHATKVLVGSREQKILERGHDQLSTYNLLAEYGSKNVRAWIEQLIEQQFLARVGEYMVLQLTSDSQPVLKGETTPRLLKPAETKKSAKVALESWDGVDRDLFEDLRSLRRELADQRGLPPFVVFSDATLRDLARRRPSDSDRLLDVHGIGERKSAQYGDLFLQKIAESCQARGIAMDVVVSGSPRVAQSRAPKTAASAKRKAFEMFAQGASVEEVATALERAESTTYAYLSDYIAEREVTDVESWVDAKIVEAIRNVTQTEEEGRLKPIFEALDGEVSYNTIRIALASIANEASAKE